MSLSSLLATYTGLPNHCTPTSQYLLHFSSAFHSCVPTSLAFLSTVLGIFSIISWLFAQLPQIYKNYQLKSASGLSIYFLGIWLLGDLLNLLGAILTRQAGWQIVVAGYYVFVDVLLDFQYFWYTYRKSPRGKAVVTQGSSPGGPPNASDDGTLVCDSTSSGSSTIRPNTEDRKKDTNGVGRPPSSWDDNTLVNDTPPHGSLSRSPNTEDKKKGTKPVDVPTKPQESQGPSRNVSTSSKKRQRESPGSFSRANKRQGTQALGSPPTGLLFVSLLCVVLASASPLHLEIQAESRANSTSELVGSISSWCSTALYLGSRVPQIVKNIKRRSTDGLSPALFLAAFFGNLFYSTSIMANPLAWESYPPYGLNGWVGPEGSDKNTWRVLAAPFWLGAAGVLFMDATIGLQFLKFGEKSVVLQDREDRSRWRKVSGWMRGWVPSPNSPAEVNVDGDEQRRLLNEEGHDSYGAT